jgi:hypothetical protein
MSRRKFGGVFWLENGERIVAKDGQKMPHGATRLSLTNMQMDWRYHWPVHQLISASFTFPTPTAESLKTVQGLLEHAKQLERLSVAYSEKPRDSFQDGLNLALKPMCGSKVTFLHLISGNDYLHFYGDWYGGLTSLTTDSEFWQFNSMPSLTAVHIRCNVSSGLLSTGVFTRLLELKLSMTTYTMSYCAYINWTFYAISKRTRLLFYDDAHINIQASQKLAEIHPIRRGMHVAFCESRRRFQNTLLMNRHVYRTRIKYVLQSAATRAWPQFGNSITDLLPSIFRLLRLC